MTYLKVEELPYPKQVGQLALQWANTMSIWRAFSQTGVTALNNAVNEADIVIIDEGGSMGLKETTSKKLR